MASTASLPVVATILSILVASQISLMEGAATTSCTRAGAALSIRRRLTVSMEDQVATRSTADRERTSSRTDVVPTKSSRGQGAIFLAPAAAADSETTSSRWGGEMITQTTGA